MNNPNSISAYIRHAVDEAITRGVNEPKSIYLGGEEHAALKAYCAPMMRFASRGDFTGRGETFMGMRVYRVLEQSHIGVA